MKNLLNFKKGVKDGLPIGLGYFAVSFAFGVSVVGQGLPQLIAVLMSATNLTSAGQFAGAGLMIAGSSFFDIGLTTFVINLRYLLMSLSLSQKVERNISVPTRMAMSFGITDEIFAVAMQEKGMVRPAYFFGLLFLPYWGWALGTLIGATAIELLPLIVRSALGIAIYGMFLAIIIPPARDEKPMLYIVLFGALVSCLLEFLPLFQNLSGGWKIIICAVLASALAAKLWPVPPAAAEAKGEM
jgi:predicted branched-subunit amino acid permease